MASLPVCADSCIYSVVTQYSSVCGTSEVCYCKNTAYLAAVHNCLSLYCNTADSVVWINYGISNCAAVGVYFTSTTTQLAATGSVVTATGAVLPPGISAYATGTAGASNPTPTGAPSQPSQDSSDGLSIGAKAGIGAGAGVIVLLAIFAAVWFWRRNRRQTRTMREEPTGIPPNSATYKAEPVEQVQVVGKEYPYNVVYSHELSGNHASFATNYGNQVVGPEAERDPRNLSQRNTPYELHSRYEPSPAPAYADISTAVPSHVDSAAGRSNIGPPFHNPAEADAAQVSYMQTPYVPELGSPRFAPQPELSASPATARSMPNSGWAAQVPPISAGTMVEADSSPVSEAELARMKAELEALRLEKEHMTRMRAIEERERELSQGIVRGELSKQDGH